MKSKLSNKIHDYTPLLPSMQKGLDEDYKPNKVGSRKEKYALRERQKRRLGLASVVEMPKRLNHHKDDIEPTTGPQCTQNPTASKSKAPPLSKYRRKTANARERTRMREINSAFENLRHCVPQSIAVDETGPANEKLTKITTLRLAMKYISLLSDALNNPNFKGELPMDFLYDTDELQMTAELTSTQPPLKLETKKKSTTTKNSKATSKSTTARAKVGDTVIQKPTKHLAKRKKKDLKIPADSVVSPTTYESSCYTASITSRSSSFNTCSADSFSSHSSSLLDSITSPSYSNPFVPSMSELNSITLESDGESLHLSDPCNSPLQDNYDSLLLGAGLLDRKTLMEHSILGEIDTPLELSLQLLGTTPQPLEFSMEHPPSTCISPLSALDTFNPFSDFLQEYPEQASMDLFLT
ncbi:LOW QUALITY PROTEIN: helix-loop-helix protein delilah [Eurosta solidaginis]|uniref:LOW QUALITY PROTEIN: helix-loop-helix protein delilah n=1 Tax=Eurosta solidaginis TaxID=178769 RepID=UPI00353111CB